MDIQSLSMEQLSFQLASDEKTLRRFFEAALKKTVHIVMTDNSTRMLSCRRVGGAVSLRLSKLFLSAPSEVLEEAASFIRRNGGPTPAISRFLRSAPAPERRRRRVARPNGAHHDLTPVFERMNREYFGGAIEATITWSRRQGTRVRRRTLGSYCPRTRTVRINPVLDNPRIPAVFLEFIVYHEMLHALIAVKETGGRRVVHSREFREKEREFRGFDEALAWERANKGLL